MNLDKVDGKALHEWCARATATQDEADALSDRMFDYLNGITHDEDGENELAKGFDFVHQRMLAEEARQTVHHRGMRERQERGRAARRGI